MAIHRIVSIEVGLTKTRICETDFLKKNPKVYKCVVFNTPENSIEDAFIRDKKIFAEALLNEMRKAEIKCQNLMFSVTSNRIMTREVLLPNVKDIMIPGVIESQKDEYFPMDISEHELAYNVLELHTETNQKRTMVYAVPQNLIKNYFNIAEEMNCKLVGIDFGGNSVYQWIKKVNAKNTADPVKMYMQINEQNTMITILENNTLALQRNINFGAGMLAESLVELIKKDEYKILQAYEQLQAEPLIKGRFNDEDMEQPEGMEEQEWLAMVDLQEHTTDIVRPLIANLNRVIEFYGTKNKTARIQTIEMLGLGTRVQGLDKLIENEIGIPTTIIENLTGLVFKKEQEKKVEQSADLINCLGASIACITYLNVKFETGKKETSPLTVMIVLLVFSILASVLLITMSALAYKNALNEKEAITQEIAEKQWIMPIYNKFLAMQAAKTDITTMDENTYTHGEQLASVIDELENKLPTNARVQSISSTETSLTINITVNTKEEAEKLLLQMQMIPYFSEVQISGLSQAEDEMGMTEVSFTISCIYQHYIEEEAE